MANKYHKILDLDQAVKLGHLKWTKFKTSNSRKSKPKNKPKFNRGGKV